MVEEGVGDVVSVQLLLIPAIDHRDEVTHLGDAVDDDHDGVEVESSQARWQSGDVVVGKGKGLSSPALD